MYAYNLQILQVKKVLLFDFLCIQILLILLEMSSKSKFLFK